MLSFYVFSDRREDSGVFLDGVGRLDPGVRFFGCWGLRVVMAEFVLMGSSALWGKLGEKEFSVENLICESNG